MRRLKDRIYLFSMSRYNCGTILAFRAEKNLNAIGHNFFDYLLIDSDQMEFFKSRYENLRDHPVVLFSGGKKRHAVIIFQISGNDSSFLIGVELLMDAEVVGYLVSNGIIPDMESLYSFLESECNEMAAIRKTYDYISDIVSLLSPLRQFGISYRPMNEFDLELLSKNLSDLIGLDIKFRFSIANADLRSGLVYSGSASVLSIMIAAFAARQYSKHRQLNIEAVVGYGEFSIRFVFVPDERSDWKMMYDSFDKVLEKRYDIYFNFKEIKRDDVSFAVAELYPFYEDVGLVGVKKREVKFYSDLPDFFILNE